MVAPVQLQGIVLLLTSYISAGVSISLTPDDREEFFKVKWLDGEKAWAAYKEQFDIARVLGRGNGRNPNRLIFYPEDRVLLHYLNGKRVVVTVFCLLSPDMVRGYRTNSVTMNLLQKGLSHRRNVLAPKRKLSNEAEQLNCWNYEQSSSCWPQRDCRENEANSVGFVTKEGWGVFQLYSSESTQAHYQCVTETQSILSLDERKELKLEEYGTIGSDVHPLLVFKSDVGTPNLIIEPSYDRGRKLTALCEVDNSIGGSKFSIDLVLKRPPPDGVPGPYRDEYLTRQSISIAERKGVLDWRGEEALLSHHGLTIECRVSGDWGEMKGRRVSRKQLMIRHMFPAYVQNPRIRMEKSKTARSLKQHYETPKHIKLRMAEYATCKCDGYPPPEVMWIVNQASAVWILGNTMFISPSAPIGRPFAAVCIAKSYDGKMMDVLKLDVEVFMCANYILPGFLYRFMTGMIQAFLLWFVLYPCSV